MDTHTQIYIYIYIYTQGAKEIGKPCKYLDPCHVAFFNYLAQECVVDVLDLVQKG